MRGKRRPRSAVYRAGSGVAAALRLGGASAALAQQAPPPQPPEPDRTTVVEPVPEPPPAPEEEPKKAEVEHVPPDASGIDLTTLETKDLDLLYFDPVQTYLTPYIARAYENALNFHKRAFHWQPWEKTTMLLKDFSDYGNAGARSSPNNAILIDVAPLSLTMETFTPGERFFTIENHELAHVATMDVWNSKDAFWRHFLHGKPMPIQEHPESILWNYLATPRVNVPRWYLEGSAVFFETWMSGGLGRAQGGYDEMVWRAKVRDDDRFYSPLGLESEGTAIDFQVGVNDYLYGTRFFSYLALKYGPDKAVEWLRRGEDSKAFYADQFKHVFGRKLDAVWGDWIAFEHDYQKANLAKLAQYPLTQTAKLSPRGLGNISRGYVDTKTNSLIAAFRYPGTIGFIGRMDLATGKLTKLQEIKGMMLYNVTSVAFDPDARTAYYTEDNYAFRDLIAVNVDTGAKHMLLKDARIGEMVVNPADKSIWGIRHENGLATIVRIPPPYAGFNQVHTFKYGEVPFDIDISPDGQLLSASFGEINGTQTVRLWKLPEMNPESDPVEVARLALPPSTPEGFVFTPDGKALYGTSYYTGVSNIFRFDIATQKWDAVSNASTGFFKPIPQPDGSLIAYEYSGQGLQPVRLQPQVEQDLGTVQFLGTKVVKERPELKQWGVGSPSKIDLDSMIVARSKYNSSRRLKLAGMYPIVEGYKKTAAPGWFVHFEDPLQFTQIDASFSVSPFNHLATKERFHANILLKSLSWEVQYRHNGGDFYDLFGPVERSLKGDNIAIRYDKIGIYDPPRQLDWFGSAALYTGLDRLPNAQNISSPSSVASFEAGAKYSNTTRALGGVDHERGIQWRALADLDYSPSEALAFPKIYGGIDYGVPLPWPNSSAWLYASGGLAWGHPQHPLGSFYFGSFRNNYVDNRSVKRYREMESFPGFEIDEIAARKFGKLTGEVNLPPVRFAEIGTPAFFLSYIRPAVFAGAMATQDPTGDGHRYYDVGTQLDLNFTVALRLPMVFSVGAAAGWQDGHYRKTEWLASLKIL
jgi:DNA-binding beta-propeller fold protein YncE